MAPENPLSPEAGSHAILVGFCRGPCHARTHWTQSDGRADVICRSFTLPQTSAEGTANPALRRPLIDPVTFFSPCGPVEIAT